MYLYVHFPILPLCNLNNGTLLCPIKDTDIFKLCMCVLCVVLVIYMPAPLYQPSPILPSIHQSIQCPPLCAHSPLPSTRNVETAMIPSYSQGLPALKAAVPTAICSANAVGNNNFGDKSGMSIPNNWKATKISAPAGSNSVNITFTFCATAAHVPNYWEFYVTVPTFNAQVDAVSWDNVVLLKTVDNLQPVSGTYAGCSASQLFKTTLTVPNRYAQGVIVSRFQRKDPAGECFINCSDFVTVKTA
ncbi:hypothetical protein SAMD00019534_017310, partial [Acytostelium subglobosum LB1]|uniref:hypothetical protein n=1 Tax=Acytostelium subglobosum LB1 TaxID=1410327 RepID=UPI000644CE75